jgi:hypothetical protein
MSTWQRCIDGCGLLWIEFALGYIHAAHSISCHIHIDINIQREREEEGERGRERERERERARARATNLPRCKAAYTSSSRPHTLAAP